jgi:hypothetical protein
MHWDNLMLERRYPRAASSDFRAKSVEGRSNRGSKVIGDHFENLFSIYRRDFLKMIGDHFSTPCVRSTFTTKVRLSLAGQPWDSDSIWDIDRELINALGQFNVGTSVSEASTASWRQVG